MEDLCTASHTGLSERSGIEMAESAIVQLLLGDGSGELWARADLEREIGGRQTDFTDALAGLLHAGVVHGDEHFVALSRAARRTIDLQL